MKGINTLINTSFFFFPPLAITHKKIPCPRAAPSNSPCLHSLSLSHSTMPGTAQHRKLQKARGCWHGEAVLRAGHPIRTSTETWERNYSATDPLRELQVSNAVCPKTLSYTAFPSSLLSYTKPKNNLRADRRDFEISIGLLSPNCLKLKFICILCRNINKRPQMYLYLYILQEPSKIIHRTKINLL